jgi:predicted ATPase
MRRGRNGRRRARESSNLFVRSIQLDRDDVPSFDLYPFSVPAIRQLKEIDLNNKVTFFVGENGSGKSTLLEAIAVLLRFNLEGGSKNVNFATRHDANSALCDHLRITRGVRRERSGFFLRSETFFNVATYLEEIGALESYGGRSLHEQSHGESLLALAQNRFHPHGLYLLDEPEVPLSAGRQLALLKIVHDLVERGNSQFIIATHSPILLAYPDATIYCFGPYAIRRVSYEETDAYRLTRDFLLSRERYLKLLFSSGSSEEK